ncbi:MAG TPA: ABC transporter substrate-binding protein [Povalibacter sp.]|nr:ABC transporter substrate-binding protein [Povalibacter sp.]
MNTHSSRIVCLSAETTETLCLLGEEHRIVGFSGPIARLPATQHRKPRVSIYTGARIDRICALEPDLVLGCGETHGDVLAALAQRGVAVHLFNQRSVRGILDMIRVVGGLVGRGDAAAALAASLEWRLEAIRVRSVDERRPCIYLEEWDEPAISASGWVSELIDIAGGTNCFADLAARSRQEDRIIYDLDEVVERAPDIIIASWIGKTFQAGRIEARSGWRRIPAVINGELHEVHSSQLQFGPAALTEGISELHRIVERWRERRTRVFQTAFVPYTTHAPRGEMASERVA